MKRILILSTLVFCALLLVGCAGGPRLSGTWVLVASGGRTLDVPETPRPGDSIKELSRERFAFGRLDENGRIQGGGGGDWFYADGRYHEVVRFHDHPVLVGETIAFDCEIEGDLWHHRAEFDAGNQHYFINEVWRRVNRGRTPEERRARH